MIDWTHVTRPLNELVELGRVPGIVFGVASGHETLLKEALGSRRLFPESLPMTTETVFDLASLTKVIATTSIALRFLERGLLRIDDPLNRYFPGNWGDVRISHLLTHTSGFPAWLNLTRARRTDCWNVIQQSVRLFPQGQKVLYSDLNYILLGLILEKLGNRRLDDIFNVEVRDPLGLQNTGFVPSTEILPNIATTEWDPQTADYLTGVVHDENARAFDGVSGHAGLFGTVSDVLRFGRAILLGGTLDGESWLSWATVSAWLRPRTEGVPGELRAWGFQKPFTLSSAGDLMSASAVGHTGFTGTSLWIDPEYGVVMALLSNRVHLGRDNNELIRLRPIFHNTVLALVTRPAL